jgi:hypothetical protein
MKFERLAPTARPSLFVCALAVTAGCFGCGHECTEIGCFDGLEFVLSPALALEGEVEIVVDGDDVEKSCKVSPGGSTEPCHDAGISPELASGGVLSNIKVFGAHPAAVTLEIRMGDTVVRQAAAVPAYETVQPNGPDCPSTCRSATIQVPEG